MPLNKAVLAAFKAASRLKPDIKQTYEAQRVAEDVMGKLSLPDPRCRIDEAVAVMRDGYEVPLRVFTPLDFDFSLDRGLKVVEDFRGTILFFHGGGWANGSVDLYIDACSTLAVKLERRVVSVDYRRSPEHRFPQAPEDCYETARHALSQSWRVARRRRRRQHRAIRRQRRRQPGSRRLAHGTRPRRVYAPFSNAALPRNLQRPTTRARRGSTRCARTAKTTCSPRATCQGYMELYCSSPEDLANPYLAPLLAPDVSNQPRTLVITAEYCPLRDEGEAFAARIDLESGEAGVLSCARCRAWIPAVSFGAQRGQGHLPHHETFSGRRWTGTGGRPGVARATWYRLDNVGKFYSSQAGSSAQTVFRYSADLVDDVGPRPAAARTREDGRHVFPASTCVYAAACSGTIWNRPPKCRP